jgi:hypothetical protein
MPTAANKLQRYRRYGISAGNPATSVMALAKTVPATKSVKAFPREFAMSSIIGVNTYREALGSGTK